MIPTYNTWMNFPEVDDVVKQDTEQNGVFRPSVKCWSCGGLVREKPLKAEGRHIGWIRYCIDCHCNNGTRYTPEYQAEMDEEEEQIRRQRDADWKAIEEKDWKDRTYRRTYS